MKNLRFYIILLLIIGAGVGWYVASGRGHKTAPAPLLGQYIAPSSNRQHLSPGQAHEPYNSKPATSGPHNAQRLPYGIKDQELSDEEIVHGLEHGGIAFWYNKNTISPAEIQQLITMFHSLPDGPEAGNPKGYLVPRSSLEPDVKVAAVAWGYLFKQKIINTEELKTFYTGHLGKGPEVAP